MAPWLSSKYTPYQGPSFNGPLDLKPFNISTPKDNTVNKLRAWYGKERARMQLNPERGFANMIYIPEGVRSRGMPPFWEPWMRWMRQDNSRVIRLVSEEMGRDTSDGERSTISVPFDATGHGVQINALELHQLSTPGEFVNGSVLFAVLTLIIKDLNDVRIMDPLLFNTTYRVEVFPPYDALRNFINHTDARCFKSLRYVFIPFHDRDAKHWLLIVLEPKHSCYSIYNSWVPNEGGFERILNVWLSKTISGEYLGEKKSTKWKSRKVNAVTQDETSCGLYVCAHAVVISQFTRPPKDMSNAVPTGPDAGLVLRRHFLGMIFKHGQMRGPWVQAQMQ